jgi:deazaflavin-dependent oxidoreductase (nitroreductase family)
MDPLEARVGSIEMAKEYTGTPGFNKVMMWMAGKGLSRAQVLTTTGRRSGESRSIPVSPIDVDGVEYLVAPYGSVSWVENARANPNVTLTKGRTVRGVSLVEVTGRPAAPVVDAYYRRESFSRRFMDVSESPTVDDFAERSEQFPVFRVDQGQS